MRGSPRGTWVPGTLQEPPRPAGALWTPRGSGGPRQQSRGLKGLLRRRKPRGTRTQPRLDLWGPPAQPRSRLPKHEPRRQTPPPALLTLTGPLSGGPQSAAAGPKAWPRARRADLACDAHATPRLPRPSRPRAVSPPRAFPPGPPQAKGRRRDPRRPGPAAHKAPRATQGHSREGERRSHPLGAPRGCSPARAPQSSAPTPRTRQPRTPPPAPPTPAAQPSYHYAPVLASAAVPALPSAPGPAAAPPPPRSGPRARRERGGGAAGLRLRPRGLALPALHRPPLRLRGPVLRLSPPPSFRAPGLPLSRVSPWLRGPGLPGVSPPPSSSVPWAGPRALPGASRRPRPLGASGRHVYSPHLRRARARPGKHGGRGGAGRARDAEAPPPDLRGLLAERRARAGREVGAPPPGKFPSCEDAALFTWRCVRGRPLAGRLLHLRPPPDFIVRRRPRGALGSGSLPAAGAVHAHTHLPSVLSAAPLPELVPAYSHIAAHALRGPTRGSDVRAGARARSGAQRSRPALFRARPAGPAPARPRPSPVRLRSEGLVSSRAASPIAEPLRSVHFYDR